jgi:hypothetical protein
MAISTAWLDIDQAFIGKTMSASIRNKPTEVEKALADAMDQTRRQPTLALSHAVALDRVLSQMGWPEPITYALHGTASPTGNSDEDGAPWRASPPGTFDCLHQALRQRGDSPGLALATAFRNARGPKERKKFV